MKLKKLINLVLIVTSLALVGAFTGCSREAKIIQLDLEIAELICEDGQKAFESRILDLDGIRSVVANIHSHKAELKFRDTEISETEILTHLQANGFTVNGVPGNPAARGRLPSCCFVE